MNHMSRLLPKADSKGNSCTTHQNHKQRSSSCSASGDNSSISGYANTYVINVRSAACSTCVSVFLASHYVSTAEQKARVGPSDRERERETGRKTMRRSASTHLLRRCNDTRMCPGCEGCVSLFTTPIKFIFKGVGKQITPRFTVRCALSRCCVKKVKSMGFMRRDVDHRCYTIPLATLSS